MKYVPKLDPDRDLEGATPEKLARALLRRKEPLRLRPDTVKQDGGNVKKEKGKR